MTNQEMTEQEAIDYLHLLESNVLLGPKITESVHVSVSAIKKQIPVKPTRIDKNETFDGNWIKVCPSCGRILIERITTSDSSYPRIYNMTAHCECGQAIDWVSTDD